MKRRDRFGLGPKQTRVQSGGAAGEGRAREAGKPGAWVQRRGEAAWPNARRTEGPFSPAKREAELGRPTGLAQGWCAGDAAADYKDYFSQHSKWWAGSRLSLLSNF